MDEQSQVVAVQRRRSRAEAAQLAAEYEGSGLSRVEFCRKQGLSLATLARYRKRQAQGEVVAGSRWVAVDISGSEPRSRASRYGPTTSMVGTSFSISPSCGGFPLHCCQSAAGCGGGYRNEASTTSWCRVALVPGSLSRTGHVTGAPRLRLVIMVASESKKLPAAFFGGPR